VSELKTKTGSELLSGVGNVAKTNFRWILAGLIFVVYTIAAADRANIGVALPFIRKDFPMSNTEAGAIASAFLLGYSIFQMPAGFSYSKWGVRKIFSAAMIATSLFTGLIGSASSPLMMKLYRFGLGMSEAPLGVGIPATINRWYPPKEKCTVAGIYFAAAKFGPVIVPPLAAIIIMAFSWREIFYFFAIPGLILSVIWFWLVKNDPSESPFCNKAEVEYIKTEKVADKSATTDSAVCPDSLGWLDKIIIAKEIKPIDTTKGIFTSWNIIGVMLGFFFIIGIVNVILTWIPTYLMTVKKYPIMQMGIVASMPWIGGVVGNIIGGWMSDRLFKKRRKPTMLITAFTLIFATYALTFAPNDAVLLSILLFGLGVLLNIGYSAFVVYAMPMTSKEKYPIAYSFVNTGGQFGGACAPLLTGMILDKFNWDAVFIFMSVYAALCFLVLLTIIEPMEKDKTA
jgi:MFS transporter, ACS family, glucarate transporter